MPFHGFVLSTWNEQAGTVPTWSITPETGVLCVLERDLFFGHARRQVDRRVRVGDAFLGLEACPGLFLFLVLVERLPVRPLGNRVDLAFVVGLGIRRHDVG